MSSLAPLEVVLTKPAGSAPSGSLFSERASSRVTRGSRQGVERTQPDSDRREPELAVAGIRYRPDSYGPLPSRREVPTVIKKVREEGSSGAGTNSSDMARYTLACGCLSNRTQPYESCRGGGKRGWWRNCGRGTPRGGVGARACASVDSRRQ